MVAVHQAVRSLRSGESDVALAGGVNALITPMVTIGFDEVGGVLAPDGRIKSFSQDADGYSRSEGGGMLVLKRVADARRDGDEIIAVIAGSAVNHDGRSNGLLAPNPDAQADVLRKAYKDAGIDPRTVDYVEAHGTGTILGDPIEADALGRVVGKGRAADRPALLGAVKSNVGHLESAAGAASLAKVALSLKNDKLPPSINYTGPNPYIDFEKIRIKVNDTVSDWPRYSGHAIAGVSGFGFGGANAHLVLREVLPSDLVEPEAEPETVADQAKPDADAVYVGGVRMDEYGEFIDSDADDYGDPAFTAATYDDEPELPGLTDEALRLLEVAREELAAELDAAEEPAKALVPLAVSGFLTSRKRTTAAELADWVDSPEGRASSLESIGRSLSRRNHGRSRAVVLAHDHDEAVKGLRALADGKQTPLVLAADGPVTNGPVWVLAGFGAQHRKMGKSLYLRDEIFAEWINKVDALVQDELGYSVVELILDDSQDYGIETTQTVIFAIQVALGELLKAHGAKPGALVGQSLGEAAAAYFSGGLSLADATRTICSRAHLMGEGEAMLFGEYIRLMALVEYSADEIKTVFSDFPDLEVCVYAAPTQTVIGGPPEQVDAIIARAESEGKFARKFQTKGASHTQQMDPLLGELAAELQGIEALPLKTPYFSTVHEGGYIRPGGEPIHDVDYWKKGLRHSVYFTHGIRNAVDNGHTTFLELAPNPVALMQVGLTTASAGLHDAQLIATLARKQDEVDSMTTAMAQLFVHGHDLDFRTLFPRASDAATTTPTSRRPASSASRTGWTPEFSADGSAIAPGAHVAMPDGRHVWEFAPRGTTPDLAALVKAAATQVLPDAKLTAFEQRAVPADDGRLVTTLTRHPGGATRAGAFAHRRVVHVGVRRDRHPWWPRDRVTGRRRSGHRARGIGGPGRAGTRRARRRCGHPAGQPHCGRGSGSRLQEVVGLLRRDHRAAAWHHRRQRHGLRARGPAVGGAADRARPGFADGRAHQEPRRVRLRPAADSADGSPRRQPLRRREAHRVRDRAPRRSSGVGGRPEDADRRRDCRGPSRTDGWSHDRGRTRGAARAEDGRSRVLCERRAAHQGRSARNPAATNESVRTLDVRREADRGRCGGWGAEPAGRRGRAQFRRPAARRRRAGHVRDVGDRHRQVAWRHLQLAAVAVRRRGAEDGAAALRARRGHRHCRRRQEGQDHRRARHHGARIPRGR